ncbi:MAG: S8 family peptidase [Bacteroidetes bacterium]|nr:S8 family peptidase [Bacteroidota bacterium]
MILFAQFTEEDNRVINEFIVMVKPAHSIEVLLQSTSSLKVKEVLSPRMNIYLLERNSIASPNEFLLSLQQNEHVKLAQFNHTGIKERSLIPNDSYFNQQWNMMNTGQGGGLPGADIQAKDAWAINHDAVTCAGDSVVIAIVDGTIDLNHEDVNFFNNRSEIPGNSIDDDGNGYIDDVNGWNASQNNGNVQGNNDHSMHLAGIAAAKGNDSVGVAGVCWGAKIIPVVYGSTTESNVVKAYDYVREMRLLYNSTFGTKGAYIVATNSSFGVDFGEPSSYPIWCAMYDSMGYVGILSASATANLNIDVETQGDIPTTCPSNYLIAVTNTTRTDTRNSGAAYGKTSIDLGAPGTQVFSTYHGNQYNVMTGTSMSTPHVAGTIGAMYSAACCALIDYSYEHPDQAALLIRDYILEGAEWISSMNNITTTNGRLNLYRAIVNLNKYNCDSCDFSIGINKTAITCKNSNDGMLSLAIDSGSSSVYTILWSDTSSNANLSNRGEGFYTVTVTDSSGCSRFASVELHHPDSVIISNVTFVPADSANAGAIHIGAFAVNEPLLYSIDGINYQQTATFSIPSNGNYTVYVRNSSGCVVQQNVLVSSVDELDVAGYELKVYPNPVSDELTVYILQFTVERTTLQIFDAMGRKIVEAIPTTTNFKLQTSNLSNGIYFLSTESAHQKLTHRFVVNK